MSHVILIALTLDEVGDADDTDLVDGILARVEEFYPTANPAIPSYRTATVVSPAVARMIDSALDVALEDETSLTARDALQAAAALDLSNHGR